MWPLRFCPILACALLADATEALSEENCNSALSRLARGAAEKAIREHQNNACSGLKQGIFGVDKTKALLLREFRLCEDGPMVRATLTVYVECATSDAAL